MRIFYFYSMCSASLSNQILNYNNNNNNNNNTVLNAIEIKL